GERHALVGAAIVLGALAAAPLASADATPQEPAPVQIAPVGTSRVQVAVVVLDHAGRPVTYLRPEDFLVLEDGKSQIVTDFIGPASGPEAEPAQEAAPVPAPRRRAPVADAPGRHIVLAVDDLHLAQDSLLAAKAALKQFVGTQISDDDDVAVVSTGSS